MTPSVSVIIPTYNRLRHLIECLRAIEGVDFPRERFEVIVVDDGGSRPVRSAIDKLSLAVDITLVRQDNAGPGSARANGARRARGRFLIFLDDDCYPERGWLGALTARLEKGRLEAVAGKTVNGCPGNFYDCASHLLSYSQDECCRNETASVAFLSTNNLAVPADLFRAAGGFRPDLTLAYEDREFCDRWRSFGYSLTYLPEAVVRHCRSMTMRSFCRQHWNYGRMASRYYNLKSNRALSRIRGHLPRLYFAIVRRAVRQPPPILVLLALSQVIAASGFLQARLRHLARKRG
jgi:GT2 family glycosyltransferase